MLASIVPRLSQFFNITHRNFSACNIEKLGMGLGVRLHASYDHLSTHCCNVLFLIWLQCAEEIGQLKQCDVTSSRATRQQLALIMATN